MQEVLGLYDQYFRAWALLLRTRDATYKVRETEVWEAAGISVAMAGVLRFAQALGEEATLSEISRWAFRKPHNTSQIINKMEQKGLIKKRNDMKRKNIVRLEITEKGQQALNHIRKATKIRWVMSALSEEELQQLSSCLEKLRHRALKELGISKVPSWP